jgi:hypothetical protein
MRTNRLFRFDFCGSTVLSVSSGHQVSFNTTVGCVVLLRDKLCGIDNDVIKGLEGIGFLISP